MAKIVKILFTHFLIEKDRSLGQEPSPGHVVGEGRLQLEFVWKMVPYSRYFIVFLIQIIQSGWELVTFISRIARMT